MEVYVYGNVLIDFQNELCNDCSLLKFKGKMEGVAVKPMNECAAFGLKRHQEGAPQMK